MSTDNQTLAPPEAGTEVSAEQVAHLLRTYVSERIAQGQQPHDLTFALALVATEMGLFFTQGRSPLPVFQNVLQGVLCAASAAAREVDKGASDDPEVMSPSVQPAGHLH